MDILEQTLETSEDAIHLKTEDIEDNKAMVDSNLTIIEDDNSMSDDQTVDNLAHAQAILDDDVQYHLRPNDGVTYRVVHVNPDEADDLEASSAVESLGAVGTSYPQSQAGTAVLNNSGHFYVINSNDIFNTQSQRSLAPRSTVQVENRIVLPSTNTGRGRRDDRRRATHNEVERRRRDKINNWIAKLSKIIPDCSGTSVENAKGVQSKGGILARACEYIAELRNADQRLVECLKENEQLSTHIEFLQKQNEKLKIDNAVMKNCLAQHGLTLPTDMLHRDADS